LVFFLLRRRKNRNASTSQNPDYSVKAHSPPAQSGGGIQTYFDPSKSHDAKYLSGSTVLETSPPLQSVSPVGGTAPMQYTHSGSSPPPPFGLGFTSGPPPQAGSIYSPPPFASPVAPVPQTYYPPPTERALGPAELGVDPRAPSRPRYEAA
jgi:hypothetical protein